MGKCRATKRLGISATVDHDSYVYVCLMEMQKATREMSGGYMRCDVFVQRKDE